MDQQACRACHATEMRQDIVAGTVRVRHSDFDAEFSCSECHRGVGHSVSGVPPVPSETVMNLCARCHDGQAAPRECKACHTADVLLAGAANSMGKIELPPPADCSGCHDLTPCTTCHQIEMPHPLDWADPKQHAPRGAFDLDPTCGRCHEPGCPECHKALHTNHGADWRTRHQSLPGGTGCVQACHDGEMIGPDMCRLCHPA